MDDYEDALAIIGMAGRFPGAADVAELWATLRSGRDALTRWEPGPEDESSYVPVKGHLEGSTRFREDLFGVSDADAALLDPQIRLLLETAWAALDDAGVETHPDQPADVGVFTTMTASEHSLAAQSDAELRRQFGALQVKLLTDKDYAATWLSYRLNLGGPSVTVQTACSSSLVALHQAATSVLLGECKIALAGGACIDTVRRTGYTYVEGGIASRTGRIRPFDVESDGAVGGNGVGLVVLKRLDDAIADGDDILALLLGTAVGNDGRNKVGFTAPSVGGHARVISAAWQNAAVSLRDIGYFEAHGTATRLGDPVEVAAFAQACDAEGVVPDAVLGSVKGALGHLDTAAGIAGVIKAVLMLRSRTMVPTPGLDTPDPALELTRRGLRIVASTTQFPTDRKMYVGVSSLGIGGTNVHVVLGEPPARPDPAPTVGAQLLPLSVQTREDMAPYAEALASAMPTAPFEAVVSTLQTGRRELGVRAFVVAETGQDATGRLMTVRAMRDAATTSTGMLFPGQTARYAGLGRNMAERFPFYRSELAKHGRVLQDEGIDLFGDVDDVGTDYWQPVLVAHQLALLALLREHGIVATHMVGHSLGEFTSAVAQGVFETEPVLRAVAARGRLMQRTDPGAMLAVRAAAQDVADLLGPEVSLAAVNGAARTVLSGAPDAIARAETEAAGRGWGTTRLTTDRAFHSSLMEPVLDDLARVMMNLVSTATFSTGHGGPWLSTVTGGAESLEILRDPSYWVRQVRDTVRYADAVALLAERVDGPLLEVGAGGELSHLARLEGALGERTFETQGRASSDEIRYYLEAVGEAWTYGARVRWSAVGTQRRRVSLPTHPWGGRDHGALTLVGERTKTTPEAQSVPEGPAQETAGGVADVLKSVLRVPASQLGASFLELGGDSLKAVQVVGRLREELGLTLDMEKLLGYDNLLRLVEDLSGADDAGASLLDALEEVLSEAAAEGSMP